jgi:hypothetical protein
LSKLERFRCKCARCGRHKRGSCLIRIDVSQQFKRISKFMVARGVRRLGRRLSIRWRCQAVVESVDSRGKIVYALARRAIRRRGFAAWSFGHAQGDIEQLVEWTAGHQLSRLGKHYLLRTTGVPMGSSISPIKASVALSDREVDAFKDRHTAWKRGFVRHGQDPRERIAGKRIADDITLMSSEICWRCLASWARRMYRKPLAIELEDKGRATTMADRFVQIEERPDGSEWLRVRRADKNTDWVHGYESTRPRVRYAPPLGQVTISQVRGWLVGRWLDELNKNGSDPEASVLIPWASMAALAEFQLLGYRSSFLRKVVRSVRHPELSGVSRLGVKWLNMFAECPAAATVQYELRQMQFAGCILW